MSYTQKQICTMQPRLERQGLFETGNRFIVPTLLPADQPQIEVPLRESRRLLDDRSKARCRVIQVSRSHRFGCDAEFVCGIRRNLRWSWKSCEEQPQAQPYDNRQATASD